MKRYIRDGRIAGGKLASAQAVVKIRRARELGLIPTRDYVLQESQRLDHLANKFFNDSQLWWILAALSDIGWGLQVPAGTIIRVPGNLEAIKRIVG